MIARFAAARSSTWIALAISAAGLLAVGQWVDLAPEVESDFFFSPDDPQLQESLRLQARYPSTDRVILRVGGDDGSEGIAPAVEALVAELEALPTVSAVQSRITEDAEESPLWSRILGVPDGQARNVVLELSDDADVAVFVPELDSVLAAHETPELELAASGAPVIVERIRQNLFRDLIVFSIASLTVFGLMLGLIYRSAWTVVGALTACLGACAATLLLVRAAGISIGLLTANIITIVFVLTLSHVVFLTANWVRAGGRLDRVGMAVRTTIEPSTWAMLTTLLGFLSLLAASAKPLRDLGLSGAIGTLTAIACAYVLYPPFLARRGVGEPPDAVRPAEGSAGELPRRRFLLPATAVTALLLGLGILRLDTDPGLLTYFDPDGEIRAGLETIDADGGSSPLELAVQDPDGALDTSDAYQKMSALQAALEAHPDVGVTLSPAVVIDEARNQPLAGLVPIGFLLNIAGATAFESSIRSFITDDRTEGRFSLRMREGGRSRPRQEVIGEVRAEVEGAGLDVTGLGGLYELQRVLGELIGRSIAFGLGGLLLLFVGVAYISSRGLRETLAMVLCLAAIPAIVLGTFGTLGIAVDIITSPAANLALAMGVDSMIHLVVRWRRLGGQGGWARARAELTQPVLAVSGMICLGFGIFALSAFPPTRRFGLAVILGTAAAAYLALVVLPRAVDRGRAVAVDPATA